MKKSDVINLIRCHSEKDDRGFREGALAVAREFESSGDHRLADYIMALLSDANTLAPQADESENYLSSVKPGSTPLPLPDAIASDMTGIINAVKSKAGVNKFLFYGPPGTGKTEAAKQIARILNKDLFMVDFDVVIDSKLGQTSKNIVALFREIGSFRHPDQVIILFDEIDALALNRSESNDVREMGRATSTLLREFDRLDQEVTLIATTNLYSSFDKALLRRFDACIDFGRYTREDLCDIAGHILDSWLSRVDGYSRDTRLFNKILSIPKDLPFPGDLSNIIKTCVAFAEPGNNTDYLCRLYRQLTGLNVIEPATLKEQGFTMREMEKLTGISKSTLSRVLNGDANEQ